MFHERDFVPLISLVDDHSLFSGQWLRGLPTVRKHSAITGVSGTADGRKQATSNLLVLIELVAEYGVLLAMRIDFTKIVFRRRGERRRIQSMLLLCRITCEWNGTMSLVHYRYDWHQYKERTLPHKIDKFQNECRVYPLSLCNPFWAGDCLCG